MDLKTGIDALRSTNVNEHTEKKNNLTYLSWPWAWSEALKADPAVVYKVETYEEHGQHGAKRTVPFMNINGTAMVCVTVTMFGKPMTCQLPVMDYRNKAIPDPDAFAVNTAIMRCMTKALSLHGLGLYIYAGEDLPQQSDEGVKVKGKGTIATPRGGIGDDLPEEEKDFLRDLAASVEALVNQGKVQEAREMVLEQALEADQMVWMSNLLDAATRRKLKEAKGN